MPSRDPLRKWERNVAFVRRRLREASATAERLAIRAGGADPKTGLRAAAALRTQAEELERLGVAHARLLEWPWAQIAEVLGVSRQAVHERYARPDPPRRRRSLPPTLKAARRELG